MKLNIHIDGACRGNPGQGSIGVFIADASGNVLKEHYRAIGECTNNIAEYTALHEALQLARELGGTELAIHSDSQLLVRQFNAQYRVKNDRLLKFLLQIQSLRRQFKEVTLTHVPREQNRDADRLANLALDNRVP